MIQEDDAKGLVPNVERQRTADYFDRCLITSG